MGIVSIVLFGLIAGLVARALTPGRHAIGCLPTVAVGIAGRRDPFVDLEHVVAELQAQLEGGGLPHPLQLVLEPRPGRLEQGGNVRGEGLEALAGRRGPRRPW